ncbi:MAG: class I SAM-dependent methyltransferase [Actinomycetota bacterium]|nr:class I SAM-dependent methyltransferase [Actinomycetota bacterium]
MVQPFDETYYINNGQIGDRPALGWYKKLSSRYLDTAHMLDFGCGTGTVIERLSPLGQVDGFDTSKFALSEAKLRNPKSNLYSQLDEIPASTFSAVVSIHVFEHLEPSELSSAIEILVRSLRADGRLLIVTPQFDGFAHKRTGSFWSGFSDNTHCNLMTAQNIRDLLSLNGFSPIKEFTDGPWNGPYITGLKLEKLLLQVPCALQVFSGRKFMPVGFGESYVAIWQLNSRRP